MQIGNGETSLPAAIETLLEGRDIKKFAIHFDNDTTGVAVARALGALVWVFIS